MNRYYALTPFEQWTEQLWRHAGIHAVSQLNIDEVADRLGVWVHYLSETSQALEYMGMRSILIDKRLSERKQWEDFLHELCHVLRHAGNQTLMPKLFCQGQEAEANRFVLYAAIPAFMMEGMKMPDRLDEAVEWMADRFGVTTLLAQRRLEQIQRRIFERVIWEEALRREFDSMIMHSPCSANPHFRE